MFQRIRASIDSALEQEQAKARALHQSPSRSTAGARKVAPRTLSPSKRAARQGSRGRQDSTSKGPDPAEFEAEFVIDDEEPSRSGTPRPATEASEKDVAEVGVIKTSMTLEDGQEKQGKEPDILAPTSELPTDVRVRLRKLEKLESRYQELLRSYRIAHARVQTIDAFETSLRENTPLTSISDPTSLVEYLNQVNLKGDMVLDELKRVSNERDSFKHRLSEAEKQTRDAWDEVAKLRTDKTSSMAFEKDVTQDKVAPAHENDGETHDLEIGDPLGTTKKSPPTSLRSPTVNIPGISLFSPKMKSLASPRSRQGSEDLFSFDGEIPRLEGEVQAKQEKIEGLENDVQKLKTDLTVARESTQSMVETLEEATREVNTLRESRDRSLADSGVLVKTTEKLGNDLIAAEAKLRELEQKEPNDNAPQVEALEVKLQAANSELQSLRNSAASYDAKIKEFEGLQQRVFVLEVQLLKAQGECDEGEKLSHGLEATIMDLREELKKAARNREVLKSALEAASNPVQAPSVPNDNTEAQPTKDVSNAQDSTSGPKKKNKKKKKGGKSGTEQTHEGAEQIKSVEVTASSSILSNDFAGQSRIEKLQQELQQLQDLLGEKDVALEGMQAKLKDQDGLAEEIETLRDELINVGQEHVEAKDKVKELMAEKSALEDTISTLEKELANARGLHENAAAGSEQTKHDLASQFEELKVKATTLQTDLSAAQQLASSRFKDLESLRTVLQKAQPEINALRSEAAEVKTAKEALAKRDTELRRLDSRHEEMRSEFGKMKQIVSSREAEIKSLNQVNSQEASSRSKAEDATTKAQQDIARLETEKRQAMDSLDRLSKEMAKLREDLATHKARLRDVEQQFSKHRSESEGLREEIELKSAQYASAQSLMSSMRDQTSEMATQMKEARERGESLDEEVADAHRLLGERSREAETMRRLLADIESRSSTQTRVMKERLDTAIEERDRAEEDASTSARRRAREIEEMREKTRDLERSLKRAEEDKDELETAQRDWKRRREELEYRSGQSAREAEEVRNAMGELRDTLDESERQARELEKQKAELRRSVEETQHRLDKLQKSNKTLADELGKVRESKKAMDSEAHSSRTSMDSTARIGSPAPVSRTVSGARVDGVNGQSTGTMDYVYLKNVLLQFLEQRDKKHQMQLIPVLGMLLHFDRKDEQKWMSAITTKA